MKKIFILSVLLSSLFSITVQSKFNVQGMSCPSGCAPKVKNAAMSIEGVEKCDVNFEESRATITFNNEKVTEAQILNALKSNTTFKYNVEKSSGTCEKVNCSSDCCKKKNKKETKNSFFKKLFNLI